VKIFISWSGEASREIAAELNDWLPTMLQYLQPFMSKEGIEKGTRWSTAIANELEITKFGIFCLTQENVNAPWIHFEAGALAKVVDESRVAPILFDLKPSDVQNPLSQFQLTSFQHDDFKKLITNINSRSEQRISDSTLNRLFDQLWPDIDDRIGGAIKKFASSHTPRKHPPSITDIEKMGVILEELLVHSREQTKLLTTEVGANLTRAVRDSVSTVLYELRNSTPAENHAVWDDLARQWSNFKLVLLPQSQVGRMPENEREVWRRLDEAIRAGLAFVGREYKGLSLAQLFRLQGDTSQTGQR
jgi:hypothetical protein